MSSDRASGGDSRNRRARCGELLAQELERASSDLTAATGGASLCALSSAAGPVPAIKYHEGRWAALREVSRLNAPDDLDRFDADCIDTAARTRELWSQQLANLRAREAGPDWIAYRSGGVDALDQLIAGVGARVRRAGHLP